MVLFFRLLSAVSYSYFCFNVWRLQNYGFSALIGCKVSSFGHFSGSFVHVCSGTIVCFIIFCLSELYFKKEACKEVDNDEIGKTTNVIDMAILSIMAMLSSIFTVVNLVELIDKLIVFEQISEILQSASVTFVSLLHMSYPFINMKNKKDKAKSSRYIAKLQQSITGYIIIGASVVLLNAHLLLAWQMDRDIDLKDKVGIISSLIMQKQTLHDDIQNESYGPKCRECRRLLSSGKIKYNKKNEKEFELSWEFKTDPQEVRKYQSTKNIANRSEMFLKNSYSRGVNTTTYKLRDIKNDKPK